MTIDHITIIGTGKVGGALYALLKARHNDVVSVSHNDLESWLASTNVVRTNVNAAPSVVVLAIPEDSVLEVAKRIASATLNESHSITDRPPEEDGAQDGILILQTNGSKSTKSLAPLHSAGFLTAAAHPFQTFANADPTALNGIAWGIECAEEAWELCKAFVLLTGGNPVRLADISGASKRKYHAAAVAASNLAYAAYSLARKIAIDAQIDPNTFLSPIIRRTYENAAHALSNGEEFAVTGPLARGNVDAVVKQLESLPKDLQSSYAHLSLALIGAVQLTDELKAALRLDLLKYI